MTPDVHDRRRARPRRGLFARLARDRRGATAVEFALISIPFLTLLFAIIETALMFFVSQVLDNAAATVARDIRTGQAQQASMTKSQMEEAICDEMLDLVNCADNLYLDVRSYDTFGAANLASPVDGSGNITGLQYDIGGSSEIVVLRAFYTWPTFFHILPTANTLPDGKRLLGAVLAFRNEPFPW